MHLTLIIEILADENRSTRRLNKNKKYTQTFTNEYTYSFDIVHLTGKSDKQFSFDIQVDLLYKDMECIIKVLLTSPLQLP